MSDNDPQPGQGDPDLGDNGQKALKAERTRANAAEQQLRAVQAQLDAATQRVTDLESNVQSLTGDVAARDLSISRLNVGIDKGLPRPLIDRLQGADADTLAADADALLALIPPPATGGQAPRPDPSQGTRQAGALSPEQEFAAFLGPRL